jgi:hypothetical protein
MNERVGNNPSNSGHIEAFYKDYKHVFDPVPEGEEDNEPTKYEMWMEVGELCTKHKMSEEDVKYVLDNYDISFDIFDFLSATYKNWHKFDKKTWMDIAQDYNTYIGGMTGREEKVFIWLEKNYPNGVKF